MLRLLCGFLGDIARGLRSFFKTDDPPSTTSHPLPWAEPHPAYSGGVLTVEKVPPKNPPKIPETPQ